MAQPVEYKSPRFFNVVSVTMFIVLGFVGYLAYQWVPLYMLRAEAYRVLEEHGSKLSSRKTLYMSNQNAREKLRRKMHSDLQRLGVDDTDAESWVEIDGDQARLGVVYAKWIHWPFDVIEPQEKIYEVEHLVSLKRN